MKRKTYTILICICIAMLLICFCIIGIFLLNNQQYTKYKKHISVAQRYIAVGNYDDAIIIYKEAIKIDNSDVKAYIGIAEAYSQINDLSNAIYWLEVGCKKTKSIELNNMLAIYRDRLNNILSLEYAVNDVINNSVDVILNVNDIENFAYYTCEDFDKKYQRENYNGGNIVRYAGFGEVTYSTVPNSKSKPQSIKIDSLSSIFDNLIGGVSYQRMQQLHLSELKTFEHKVYNTYVTEFKYSICKITIQSDKDGNIVKKDPFINIVFEQIEKKDNSSEATVQRVFKGQVVSATTGKGASGVKIKLVTGSKNNKGDIYYEGYCDDDGQFRADIKPGVYTVVISGENYVTYEEELEIKDDSTAFTKDFVVTPEMKNDMIRIVLTWGESPRDIDSYLDGVTASGFTIRSWYGNKIIKDNNGNDVCTLDIDHMYGNGIETTTLYDTSGEYEFYVRQFSADGSLAQSGAIVRIYTNDSTNPIEVAIPEYGQGGRWRVCRIVDGEVSIINSLE